MRKLVFFTVFFSLSTALPATAHGAEFDLEIITPHNSDTEAEFERGFIKAVGRPVRIRWITKGTGQILQQLDAQQRATPGGSFELDLLFGGGVPDHELAASKGYLDKPRLPDAALAGIPPTIAGVPTYDPNGRWYGAALSSFGVLVNRRGLTNQKLPDIAEWKDLGDPRLYSWVVLADPRPSSSVRVSYELILQQYGWERGWPLLMQIFANARLITDSASAIPGEVAGGNALVGPCIDFYAHGRVAEAGADVLIYVNPAGGSAIAPDPIALLRRAPHRELAEKFIAFVLSPEGQRLWVLPVGAAGGPAEHALRRLPVRPDVCALASGAGSIKDPYKQAEAGTFRKLDERLYRQRNQLLAELIGAALVDPHEDARMAWKALADGGMKPEALAEWNQLPFAESALPELAQKLEAGERETKKLTRQWTQWAQAKYARVRELAK
jgi:iron(III) transport system substrate-binding protein